MTEGRTDFRRLSGAAGTAPRALLICLPAIGALYLLDVHLLLGIVILRPQYLALLLSITLGAVFLSVPSRGSASSHSAPWYDWVLSVCGIVVGLYLVILYPDLIYTMGELSPERIFLGALAIALVVEATRRVLGWVIVFLVMA